LFSVARCSSKSRNKCLQNCEDQMLENRLK
jgi:hypothetical protein